LRLVMPQFGHKLLEIARLRDGFPFFFLWRWYVTYRYWGSSNRIMGNTMIISNQLNTGWWIGTFFIFPYSWNNHPN